MKTVCLYIAFFLFSFLLMAQSPAAILVKVTDQAGKPVSGEAISVQNSDYFTTDHKGEFTLPFEKLRVPVRGEFRNEKYEILEIAYFEEENLLKVKANRLYHPDEILKIIFSLEEGHPDRKIHFYLQGTLYGVNPPGILILPYPVQYRPASVEAPDFEVLEEIHDKKNHELFVLLRPLPDDVPAGDTLMLSYEADFERIAREIEKERYVYEQKNREIQEEILKIRDKLVMEDQFTEEQRIELRRYLEGMEKVLKENSEIIKQSEARTRDAIAKLRSIIMEKDSVHQVAQGRIVQMEEKQVKTEKEYKAKTLIYASIIVALILISLVIYVFAVRLRKQKQWLKEVNKRLKSMQLELTASLRELSRKKAQIEDHNSQLELFVYKASHDIKGPLRSIIGLTQIGIQDVQDKTAQEYFGHINKSTQRLDNLLADLLRLTKAKQAEVEKQQLNLHQMVEEVIGSFKNIRHFDRIKFNVDVQENLYFESDEKMVYSVIQNFVENGIKYCDPKKEELWLNISIKQESGKTTFLFEDNGLGIHPDHLPKIFDMFYKINPSSDGTGLGLHIVKVTIEKLGGTIKVNSRAGFGSLFTISFYE